MAKSVGSGNFLSLSDLAKLTHEKPETVYKKLIKFAPKVKSTQIEPPLVRRYLESQNYKYVKKILSVQMLKGGVAKTTTALNIGFRASMYGAKVLLIDLDQQANLTFATGNNSESDPVWIDLLEKKSTIFGLIQKVDEYLDLIPSNLNNSILDRVLLSSQRNWSTAVSAPLAQIQNNYDLIILDTAPALSVINTAVALASDEILLPMNPDRFSLMGARKHKLELEEIQKEFNKKFDIKFLFTRFDGREKLSHEMLDSCIEEFSDHMMSSYVRTSTEVKNSLGTTQSIYLTQNTAKEDYDLVTQEVLEWD